VLLALLLIATAAYFLSIQVAAFSNQIPMLQRKVEEMLFQFQNYLSLHFQLSVQKQEAYVNNALAELKPFVEKALGNFVGSMAVVFLVPVYTFLFLYYKSLLLNFIYDQAKEQNYKEVTIVLTNIKSAIQKYMVGILLEAIIIGSLNSTVLLLFGIKYAILLGLLGAMLNVLPFIGGILAVLFPLLIATVTKDGYSAHVGIMLAYLVIQFVDNHFIVPYIVSSQVKINALISIIIVLLGGSAWGVAGMFLSIPFIGVLKIILDHIPALQSFGKLLGNEVPIKHKGQLWLQRRTRA
jgi:predicted PurR-regulated permease PerM